MTCHYCGASVAANEIFCHCCGTRQTQPAPKSPAPAEPLQEVAFVPAPVPAEEVFPEITVSRVAAPSIQLPEKRGLCKMIFLGLITLGIYPTVIWSRIVTELNIAASRYDGQRTMPWFAMVILAPITLGVYPLVWMHDFCARIRDELRRRQIDYNFGPRHFWLWNVLGCLIIVGPFIFVHKLMKAMNLINSHFNING